MKTRHVKKITRLRRHSRRRQKPAAIDPNCWGKNKPLEQFWRDLSAYLSVVVIYKGSKPYEVVMLNPSTASVDQFHAQVKPFDDDPSVLAILSAYPNTLHAYETLVYPKAKDKTVDYVIKHYETIFKRTPRHMQKMFKEPLNKIRVPL